MDGSISASISPSVPARVKDRDDRRLLNAETFKTEVLEFVDTYEGRWGIKMDDDSTWERKG